MIFLAFDDIVENAIIEKDKFFSNRRFRRYSHTDTFQFVRLYGLNWRSELCNFQVAYATTERTYRQGRGHYDAIAISHDSSWEREHKILFKSINAQYDSAL